MTGTPFAAIVNFVMSRLLLPYTPFGKDLVLCTKYEKNRPSIELDNWEKYLENWDSHPYERMKTNGLNVYEPIEFEHVREVYVITFGEDPLDVWIQTHTGMFGRPLS